jgi:subtilisin family serine protease
MIGMMVAVVLWGATAQAERIRVTSQDELPRFSYEFTGKVTDLVVGEEEFAALAPRVRADLERLLTDYDIADRTTVQGIVGHLAALDLLEGRYDAALARYAQMRELEEKPAAKLLIGLLGESIIAARRATEQLDGPAFRAAFSQIYGERVRALPWEVVGEELKQSRGSLEIVTEALVLGNLESAFQPGVDRNGTLSGDLATLLVSQRNNLRNLLPLRAERLAVITAYIAEHQVEKPDIWAARDFALDPEAELTPVVVAIWDSGVDPAPFAGQLFVNTAERFDGTDTDGNGFVDDVHGIAFDLKSNPVPEILHPLTPEQFERYPAAQAFTKGLLDLQANVESPEAAALRDRMRSLQQDEVAPFLEELGFFGNYTHGTHVAGIAAAGNPAIRLLVARVTFDHRQIPDVPTKEDAARSAAAAQALVGYFRTHGVRVANLSWGGSARGIEIALEMNGAGGTPEERRTLAREIWGIYRDGLEAALASAPDILFVVAAGNSDNDVSFDEVLPSGLDLPNMLAVGAVDQAGDITSFTSHGAQVAVHANGYKVESYVPGGERVQYSGTSMAAPNVANLAAKLLALEPSLTVPELKALIVDAAETASEGRVRLVHPRRSLELLQDRRG